MVALDSDCQTNQYVIYFKASPILNSNTWNAIPKSKNGIRHIVLLHYTLLERILKYYLKWKIVRGQILLSCTVYIYKSRLQQNS